MNAICVLPHLLCVVSFLLKLPAALPDSITASQSLRDGETLVSSGGSFELGFFSPGSSAGRYVGIWYYNIPVRTVVWVANRQNPVGDLSGSLSINSTGGLVLLNGTDGLVWSTGFVAAAQNPAVQLLDTGNLVLRDGNTNSFLWQSFDYPADTLLPGMKLGLDLRTSLNRRLSSWKSPDDPSPGELSNGIELDTPPQAVMMKGTRKYFRGGPWNGLRFSGAPELRTNPVFSFKFVANQEEVYYMYQLLNTSVITRLVLNDTTSNQERYVWVGADNSWRLYASVPRDYCDNYGLCGANSICIISESPVCQCLNGFKPRSPQSWNSVDWSNGCMRSEPLNCSEKHGFVKLSGIKLPDTVHSWVNITMNLKECRETCLRNCSCMAYTNSDIRGHGSGCALWYGDLVDIRQFSDGGQDLYVRTHGTHTKNKALVIAGAIVVPFIVFVFLVVVCCFLRRRKMKARGKDEDSENEDHLPFLQLAVVARATDNFSVGTKLGEGGFGPVYKGLLTDGRHIAVKRLSKISGQGLNEFANEVKLIAKLQHRNLVRLLGCCIEHDEKILVYEYMPNGSLDSFLFDQTKGSILNWSKRFGIICGIARGLVYLHQDSRLRIIHRDLKPSNVLLDNELNPKISDFGLARAFGGDQNEENTRQIVGTYGYMAPEYAVYGLFSAKSDVFSFGILVLEIVSGKKNIGSHHTKDVHHNLIGYAWKLWTESRPLELLDSSLDDMLLESEMIRCIHVGLLCVQQNPEDRPTMSTVVVMLNGEGTLPQPKQPGFLLDLIPSEAGSSSCKNESGSVNDFSITKVMAR